jgi:hypothetical protein
MRPRCPARALVARLAPEIKQKLKKKARCGSTNGMHISKSLVVSGPRYEHPMHGRAASGQNSNFLRVVTKLEEELDFFGG